MDVSVVSVVCCQRCVWRADHSSRGVLPTVLRRCVWSKNLVNEEAMAHWGLWRQKQRYYVRYFKKKQGVIHKEFVPKGKTVNRELYVQVLDMLWKKILRARPQIRRETVPVPNSGQCPCFFCIIMKLSRAAVNISPALSIRPCASRRFFLFPKVKIVCRIRRIRNIKGVEWNVTAERNVTAELNAVLRRTSMSVSIVGEFAKFRKATVCFIVSVCLSLCPHGTTGLPLDGFSLNFLFWYFSKIYSEVQVSLKSGNSNGTSQAHRCACVVISRSVPLRVRKCFRHKLCLVSKHILHSVTFISQ
jgi:hypothetical protein